MWTLVTSAATVPGTVTADCVASLIEFGAIVRAPGCAGTTVSFVVLVVAAVEVLPAGSVAVTLTPSGAPLVASLSEDASIGVTLNEPSAAAGLLTVTWGGPSDNVTSTVLSGSAEPLTVT